MTAMEIPLTGASPASSSHWDTLPWDLIKKQVKRLQVRIAKATREGKKGKVRALQRLLTHSFYAKCMAVKRVVQNKGAKTSGVDGIIWRTTSQKIRAITTLKRRGYKPMPLKRIYIPKKGGNQRKRGLSIPTMKDRAMQALWLLALEPIAEERADPNSYGFRPKRCAVDAIVHCHNVLSKRLSARWVLNGDIKTCFDSISHKWLLENIPMDKVILRKFLEAGFMEKGQLYPTINGAPQGGNLSPTLTVMTLSGLEAKLKRSFRRGTKVNCISYADDFIATGATKELLESGAIPIIKEFLAQRGLELSMEKTTITHVEQGFDFLGYHIRKYKAKLLTKPSKASIKAFSKDIRSTVKSLRGSNAETLIHTLNPKIRGWCQYFRYGVSARVFSHIDTQIYQALNRWMRREHPKKGIRWCVRKYYKTKGTRNWVFSAKMRQEKCNTNTCELIKAASFAIKRHVKIRSEAHPYNPKFKDYFKLRDKGWTNREPGCGKTALIKA